MKRFTLFAILGIIALLISGCAATCGTKPATMQDKLSVCKGSLKKCIQEKDAQAKALAFCQEEKGSQIDELNQAMANLEESLKAEIAAKEAKLEMTERGLVVTFLSEIFFDSGKNKIKDDAAPVLENVAKVLKEDVPDSNVAIEGHTDNVPIKYSGWKSNWELASGRALSVLHYFVDKGEINPERLSAISYGEYKPVDDNQTKEGRQRNRRVEIVILPKLTKEQR